MILGRCAFKIYFRGGNVDVEKGVMGLLCVWGRVRMVRDRVATRHVNWVRILNLTEI